MTFPSRIKVSTSELFCSSHLVLFIGVSKEVVILKSGFNNDCLLTFKKATWTEKKRCALCLCDDLIHQEQCCKKNLALMQCNTVLGGYLTRISYHWKSNKTTYTSVKVINLQTDVFKRWGNHKYFCLQHRRTYISLFLLDIVFTLIYKFTGELLPRYLYFGSNICTGSQPPKPPLQPLI